MTIDAKPAGYMNIVRTLNVCLFSLENFIRYFLHQCKLTSFKQKQLHESLDALHLEGGTNCKNICVKDWRRDPEKNRRLGVKYKEP